MKKTSKKVIAAICMSFILLAFVSCGRNNDVITSTDPNFINGVKLTADEFDMIDRDRTLRLGILGRLSESKLNELGYKKCINVDAQDTYLKDSDYTESYRFERIRVVNGKLIYASGWRDALTSSDLKDYILIFSKINHADIVFKASEKSFTLSDILNSSNEETYIATIYCDEFDIVLSIDTAADSLYSIGCAYFFK